MLVAFAAILFTSCGEETASPTTAASVTQQGPSAERIYQTMCALCHGPDGTKAYAGAEDLSESTLSMDERVAIIRYGKGTMVPFGERLSDEEIRSLAEYLETLRK